MRFKGSPILLIFCALVSGYLHGQAWSGVLNPARAIDWSHAGAAHINDVRTQCVTSQCAVVSNGTVTAATLNAAIASAPANTYVLIPAGTFTISAAVVVPYTNSNITLRGSGANSTFLTFTGTGSSYSYCANFDFCAASSDTNNPGSPSNTANWTAGYTKGATSITLTNVNSLAVGNPLILDQLDDGADNNGLWVGCEAQNSRCGNDGPSSYQRANRGQQQYVTVTSIVGNTVGITPGLYASNWRSSQTPGAWWATHPVQNVGFENFSWSAGSGAGGMFLFNCQGCWAKGLRGVVTFATGTGYGNIVTSGCNHCTVRDSYFFGHADSDDYVIAHDGGSDLLVENNIMQFPGTFQFYNSDCEGCVSAYNYSAGTLYGAGTTDWMGAATMFHAVSLYALTEGNIGGEYWSDGYHGTHNLNTAFRNRFDGRERDTTVVTGSNTAAIQIAPGSRYHNFIGNVLGTVGYHTSYLSTPSSNRIWSSVIVAGQFPGTGGTDSLPYPTSMFWGNWDVVSNAVRWCGNSSNTGWSTTCSSASEVPSGLSSYSNAVPSSETLPASFYLNTKPSWWPTGKAWPPIGPEVTGGSVGQCVSGSMQSSSCSANSQCPGSSCSAIAGGKVVSTPAMDCYFTKMGGPADGTGPALSFDASACYSSSGGGGGGGSIAPPSGLSAVVQ